MCGRFEICGNSHKRIKRKFWNRNRKGQWIRDLRLTKLYIVTFGIVLAVSLMYIGVNQVYEAVRGRLEALVTVIEVQNTHAYTWQDEVNEMLRKAGIDVYVADQVIYGESRWDVKAVHKNKDGSVDRGLWQISSYYHPEVSKNCALNPICSTYEAIKIIKARGFQEWVAYKYINK